MKEQDNVREIINEDIVQYAKNKYNIDLSKVILNIVSQSYEEGYEKAIEDINKPALVIIKEWNPSQCPKCKGYYSRSFLLERCPFCGQKLKWS